VADLYSGLKKKDKGTYLLVLKLREDQKIRPGKLQEITFKHGTYLYIGRARRALQGRLKRHLREKKKLFWHIDYFLQKAKVEEVWIKTGFFDECRVAQKVTALIKDAVFPLEGFGSSDCGCTSHLIYLPQSNAILKSLREKLSFEKLNIHGN
jgi:Uri superfamily endonuclease